jgi:hypothetical protein
MNQEITLNDDFSEYHLTIFDMRYTQSDSVEFLSLSKTQNCFTL